ncbi:unnamed protein product, partial [Mesorhabditis spiculigera]
MDPGGGRERRDSTSSTDSWSIVNRSSSAASSHLSSSISYCSSPRVEELEDDVQASDCDSELTTEDSDLEIEDEMMQEDIMDETEGEYSDEEQEDEDEEEDADYDKMSAEEAEAEGEEQSLHYVPPEYSATLLDNLGQSPYGRVLGEHLPSALAGLLTIASIGISLSVFTNQEPVSRRIVMDECSLQSYAAMGPRVYRPLQLQADWLRQFKLQPAKNESRLPVVVCLLRRFDNNRLGTKSTKRSIRGCREGRIRAIDAAMENAGNSQKERSLDNTLEHLGGLLLPKRASPTISTRCSTTGSLHPNPTPQAPEFTAEAKPTLSHIPFRPTTPRARTPTVVRPVPPTPARPAPPVSWRRRHNKHKKTVPLQVCPKIVNPAPKPKQRRVLPPRPIKKLHKRTQLLKVAPLQNQCPRATNVSMKPTKSKYLAPPPRHIVKHHKQRKPFSPVQPSYQPCKPLPQPQPTWQPRRKFGDVLLRGSEGQVRLTPSMPKKKLRRSKVMERGLIRRQ